MLHLKNVMDSRFLNASMQKFVIAIFATLIVSNPTQVKGETVYDSGITALQAGNIRQAVELISKAAN